MPNPRTGTIVTVRGQRCIVVSHPSFSSLAIVPLSGKTAGKVLEANPSRSPSGIGYPLTAKSKKGKVTYRPKTPRGKRPRAKVTTKQAESLVAARKRALARRRKTAGLGPRGGRKNPEAAKKNPATRSSVAAVKRSFMKL
jgi:hypothetical protein